MATRVLNQHLSFLCFTSLILHSWQMLKSTLSSSVPWQIFLLAQLFCTIVLFILKWLTCFSRMYSLHKGHSFLPEYFPRFVLIIMKDLASYRHLVAANNISFTSLSRLLQLLVALLYVLYNVVLRFQKVTWLRVPQSLSEYIEE